MIKQTIGLIGAGNMGAAILHGLLKKKLASPRRIWVYDKIQDKALKLCAQWKLHRAGSSSEVARSAQIIILAVKPQDLSDSVAEFKEFLGPKHLLISILAGTPVRKLQKAAGKRVRVVRAMPNLAAKVGQAVTAVTGGNKRALALAERIFSGCGKTVRLKESYFDLVTAVSGSGPAYFFLLMESLAKAAVASGLPAKESQLLAVQTAVGAALLAASSDYSPAELRIMVTSKGGTTEAALEVLENKNFHGLFKKAVKAAHGRSRELSKN